jgi:hypothetical protein
VALGVFKELLRGDVFDAAFIDHAVGEVPRGDQVTQPLGGVGVDLVVEGERFVHAPDFTKRSKIWSS